MFHPTLVVEDLEETSQWFGRVFGRKEVRWEEKWDLSLLNPTYPVNYSYFFVMGDVAIDALCPRLLVLPGGRTAIYPAGEGLVDIAWYDDDVSGIARILEKNGFRTRDQEGVIIHDGDVPPANTVWDCPMIWTLPEDSGLTYEFYHLAERHRARYARRAAPFLDRDWVPDQVADDDPLGVLGSAHHTILTHDRQRALRFYSVVGGQELGDGYDERLDAEVSYVAYAQSVLKFATPRNGRINDVLTGEPSTQDQYEGITFRVVDVEKVAAHLDEQQVPYVRHDTGIHTVPGGSKGVAWGFVPDLAATT
jgi:catechol 2,3-dioxygenase-like lactoylglutathione lyase family enzyme